MLPVLHDNDHEKTSLYCHSQLKVQERPVLKAGMQRQCPYEVNILASPESFHVTMNLGSSIESGVLFLSLRK